MASTTSGMIEREKGWRARMRARIVIVVAAMVVLTACSESRATRLAKRAEAQAREEKYTEAIATMQTVEARFPRTMAGRGARKQILLYQGLLDAELKKDRRRAKDEMLALARELLEYHQSLHRYPRSLDEIDPLGALPREDPWSGEYRYESTGVGAGYRLECLGSDGAPGGEGDAQDLLVVSGTFVKDLPWEDR